MSLERRYDNEQIDALINNARFVSLEHTGVGYFLTVSHPLMLEVRSVCSDPQLKGDSRMCTVDSYYSWKEENSRLNASAIPVAGTQTALCLRTFGSSRL